MNCDRFTQESKHQISGDRFVMRSSNPPNKNVVEVIVKIGEYRRQSYKNVLE